MSRWPEFNDVRALVDTMIQPGLPKRLSRRATYLLWRAAQRAYPNRAQKGTVDDIMRTLSDAYDRDRLIRLDKLWERVIPALIDCRGRDLMGPWFWPDDLGPLKARLRRMKETLPELPLSFSTKESFLLWLAVRRCIVGPADMEWWAEHDPSGPDAADTDAIMQDLDASYDPQKMAREQLDLILQRILYHLGVDLPWKEVHTVRELLQEVQPLFRLTRRNGACGTVRGGSR